MILADSPKVRAIQVRAIRARATTRVVAGTIGGVTGRVRTVRIEGVPVVREVVGVHRVLGRILLSGTVIPILVNGSGSKMHLLGFVIIRLQSI